MFGYVIPNQAALDDESKARYRTAYCGPVSYTHLDVYKRQMHGLVLGLIFRRGGIYAVQTLAVAGEQPQGELAAHIGQSRLIHGLDSLPRLLDGLASEEGRAVAGVGPDGPYYAGGRERDAGGIVDLLSLIHILAL